MAFVISSMKNERWPIAFARPTLMVVLAMFTIGAASGHAADALSGSGVVVGGHGEVLTNAHVVNACAQINIRSSAGNLATAQLIVRDEKNDLAVVRSATPLPSVAVFREGRPARAGDPVVVLGYPLSGLLATTANLTVGNVSALAGLGDDARYLQISAPLQPGNSGGPLLDVSGHLIGIATAKLDAALVARFTGDIPQNVNFALKAEVVRTFLDSKGIEYRTARSDQQLSPADVGEIARPFTVQIECQQPDRTVLACYGKIRVTDFGSHDVETTQEGQSMSLTVDRSAGTIAIQEYDPVEIGLGEDTWIFNTRAKGNAQIHFDGYVNSVTGETVVDIHYFSLNELRRFEGSCKPAKQAGGYHH
jgi:S1-C subfamily serine protease